MDETANQVGSESPEPINIEAAFDDYLTRQATGAGDSDSEKQPAAGADDGQPAGDAKPDAEAATDANEQRFKVKVNGEEREVPLTELVKGYQLESDYRIKTSQTAEQSRAAQEQFTQAQAMQQHYGQQLAQYQQQLAQMQPQAPDPALIESDPVSYLRQQQAWQGWQGQMQRTQYEGQQLQAQQAQQQRQFTSQHLAQQAELLGKAHADFADPVKSATLKSELSSYLQKSGYSGAEVSGVTDHRAVVMARKAMLYDQMTAKQSATADKLVNLPPKAPQRPGVANTGATDGRNKAVQSLSRSGSIDDAARAFASMLGNR